ncbi:MAG: hypothetical protein ABR529_04990 [Actinomycetota bacterium]
MKRTGIAVLAVALLIVASLYVNSVRTQNPGGDGSQLPTIESLSGKGQQNGKKQGKVTICHRTGSESNPYVRIRVNRNALKGHRNHPPKNGRNDIIPAPPGGCPGAYGSSS